MRADSPADARQGIRLARQAIGLFEPPLGNQANVASGIGMGRAGHHAGKVCMQPIPVDLLVFKSLQHCGTFTPSSDGTSTRFVNAPAMREKEKKVNLRGAAPCLPPLPFLAVMLVLLTSPGRNPLCPHRTRSPAWTGSWRLRARQSPCNYHRERL